MQTRLVQTLAPSLLLALAACGPDDVRTVGAYDAVDNQTAATLRVSGSAADGDPETVEVDCLESDPGDIVVETSDDDGDDDSDEATVTVIAEGEVTDCSVIVDPDALTRIDVTGDGDLTVEGTTTSLSEVTVGGSGAVDIEAVDIDRFDLVSTGTGELTVDDVMVNRLGVEMTGTSDATFAGEATVAEVVMDGTSALYAADLMVGELDIEMTGDSTVEISVEDDVDAELSGNALLEVYGGEDIDTSDVEEIGDASFVLNES